MKKVVPENLSAPCSSRPSNMLKIDLKIANISRDRFLQFFAFFLRQRCVHPAAGNRWQQWMMGWKPHHCWEDQCCVSCLWCRMGIFRWFLDFLCRIQQRREIYNAGRVKNISIFFLDWPSFTAFVNQMLASGLVWYLNFSYVFNICSFQHTWNVPISIVFSMISEHFWKIRTL